jgi:hypothetical protein
MDQEDHTVAAVRRGQDEAIEELAGGVSGLFNESNPLPNDFHHLQNR